MNDLSKQLHASFCAELNKAWFKGVENNKGSTIATNQFLDLANMIRDARNNGYEFVCHFDPFVYLHNTLSNEDKMANVASWDSVNMVTRVIDLCTERGWECAKTKLLELKNIKTKVPIEEIAVQKVKNCGPFYITDDLTKVYALAITDCTEHEIVLLSIVYGIIDFAMSKQ